MAQVNIEVTRDGVRLVGPESAVASWQRQLGLAPRHEVLGLIRLLHELFGTEQIEIQNALQAALESPLIFRESLTMWRRVRDEEASLQRLWNQANFGPGGVEEK